MSTALGRSRFSAVGSLEWRVRLMRSCAREYSRPVIGMVQYSSKAK